MLVEYLSAQNVLDGVYKDFLCAKQVCGGKEKKFERGECLAAIEGLSKNERLAKNGLPGSGFRQVLKEGQVFQKKRGGKKAGGDYDFF